MEEKCFKVIDGKKRYPVFIDTIMSCEARTVRTIFHTMDGKEYLHDRNIGTVIKDSGYDPRLMKSHKSFIINIRQVHYLETTKNGKFAVLKNSRRVPVSRRNYEQIEKELFTPPPPSSENNHLVFKSNRSFVNTTVCFNN